MDRRYRFENTNTYELELRIDELVDEDIEEPIVLVKEYRDGRNKDKIGLIFMPKVDLNEDLEGGGGGVEGCIIDDKEVDVDGSKKKKKNAD